MTRLLGAILAGGRSSRFGSDKALAMLGGRRLLDHAAAALAPQVDALLVCGREWPGIASVPDRPAPDLGPLGGIAAALQYGLAQGYDAVITVPCDVPLLPPDLVAGLSAAGEAACVASLPVIGRWPTRAAPALDALLAGPGNRSVRAFADAIGAVQLSLTTPLVNVNGPGDLEALAMVHTSVNT